MPIPASLKKRWHALGNTRQILTATQNLTVSPFGSTEYGLLDFRGIQLIGDERSKEETAKLPPIEQFPASLLIPHSGILRDADFSGSLWSDVSVAHQNDNETMRFDNVRFNGSTFKAKNAANFGGLSAQLADCDFDGCAFPKNIAFARATLQNCRFTRIKKSSRLSFLNSLLENCTFEGDIRKADFDATPMKNCTFSGSLKACSFQGEFSLDRQDAQTSLENVDFSQAELLVCTIANYDFGTAKPSPRNCIVRQTQAFYQALVALIRQQKTSHADRLLDEAEDCRPHPQTPYGVFHADQLATLSPKHYDAETSRLFYDCICQAAEATGCRMK
ncbi:hypothetical protein HMPREF9120_01956 [Neisseria sp. oral taxon 020 str. F0370]|uniref:pentapeptide repeat-containing protein n=1 Tax=unclassified Neisseria TaxID=2623750 RepID=UPI0002A34D72|nr:MULTISPECIES: pentapeptide repeat-containing protein [unclassified Neisseria]ASP17569.1 pentapeptide repeat-containing protein [Neisseria sp. KEM232]EKY05203.1 hypothetical protein HMPREF9120_01956 [Neisseria sp. oral taxon 020 str. F0370]